ncbi:MAG TPA: ketoacyl-ACP synthase III [Thermoanaerobaculia bacterium]|nr:ketoacyl-ACP synthase III [Thermoanaerobaculia bacterium]
MSSRRAAIAAISSHFPSVEVTNDQLASEFGGDWTAQKIYEKTGVRSRRIAAPNETASDLGVAAAQKLFESGACAPADVDYLLFCTQSPDYFLPTSACTMQPRLGLRTDSGAIDFNQGCSGWVYGLSLAKSLIEAGTADKVLLVTAETYSKYINARDRSVRTIFGDAAAATLVTGVDADREMIGPFVFGTDGRGACNLIVPTGGARRPATAEMLPETSDSSGNWRSDANLFMNGPEIFNFTLQSVPKAVSQLLSKTGKAAADVEFFIFHQANRFMLERLRAKIAVPAEKFWIDIEQIGNTVSSTIPIAWQQAREQGRLRTGERVMAVGFGVGYSWSAAMAEVL